MPKFYRIFEASALFLLGLTSCSTEVAGGVSEETNTVAGVLTDSQGRYLSKVAVSVQHVTVDSLAYSDTTDESGNFAFPLTREGYYGLSASKDSTAHYSTFKYSGDKLELTAEMDKTTSFTGKVILDSSLIDGVEIRIPGTSWITESDSAGQFHFKDIPVGVYAILVESPDPVRYMTAAYLLDAGTEGVNFTGPQLSSNEIIYNVDGFSARSDSTVYEKIPTVQLPLSTEYGLMSWWPMDYLTTSENLSSIKDARGHADGIILYGGAQLVEGPFQNALALKGADQFGVAENDNGILDGADQFTLELLLKLDSVKTEGSFRRNIMGKLGFGSSEDQDVFSLALVKNGCNTDGNRLAFFLADGSGDSLSCENAAVSKNLVQFGQWIHLIVVFENEILRLYENGVLTSETQTGIKQIQKSGEPIFFGKEDLSLTLDDVRLGVKAITSVDVLYRYNLKGGAL